MSFSAARPSISQRSATADAVIGPSASASKTPTFVATIRVRPNAAPYGSSIGVGTMPDARPTASSGFSAMIPKRMAGSSCTRAADLSDETTATA